MPSEIKGPGLLFIAPSAKFFLSHRAALGRAALDHGFTVAVACPEDGDCAAIEALGMKHVVIPLSRAGLSPGRELRTFLTVWRIFRQLRPSIAHLITAKPALYGGLAARLTATPTITAVTGLGHLFIQSDRRTRAVRTILLAAYRFGLRRPQNHFIFQNRDDMETFARFRLLDVSDASILPGSGVDLDRIRPKPLPDGPPLVLMPSRMLGDKGVGEFVEAASIINGRGITARFKLLGDPDPENPTSLTSEQLLAIDAAGIVQWQPHVADIGSALAEASIVVLPSYREGFPKTLIDASAAGRAMVTTDVPGCRDSIIPYKTGLLCKVRDPGSLADSIAELLQDPARIIAMGIAARADAERRFDLNSIVSAHLGLYDRYCQVIR